MPCDAPLQVAKQGCATVVTAACSALQGPAGGLALARFPNPIFTMETQTYKANCLWSSSHDSSLEAGGPRGQGGSWPPND
jgi:hypothetical protein